MPKQKTHLQSAQKTLQHTAVFDKDSSLGNWHYINGEKNKVHTFFHRVTNICIGIYWIIHLRQTRQKTHLSKRYFSIQRICILKDFPVLTAAENCVKMILRSFVPVLRVLWLDRQVWHSKSNRTVSSSQQNMNMLQSELASNIPESYQISYVDLENATSECASRPWSTVLENWSLPMATIYSLNLYCTASVLSNSLNNIIKNTSKDFNNYHQAEN